jgi:hypothetical protein
LVSSVPIHSSNRAHRKKVCNPLLLSLNWGAYTPALPLSHYIALLPI